MSSGTVLLLFHVQSRKMRVCFCCVMDSSPFLIYISNFSVDSYLFSFYRLLFLTLYVSTTFPYSIHLHDLALPHFALLRITPCWLSSSALSVTASLSQSPQLETRWRNAQRSSQRQRQSVPMAASQMATCRLVSWLPLSLSLFRKIYRGRPSSLSLEVGTQARFQRGRPNDFIHTHTQARMNCIPLCVHRRYT